MAKFKFDDVTATVHPKDVDDGRVDDTPEVGYDEREHKEPPKKAPRMKTTNGPIPMQPDGEPMKRNDTHSVVQMLESIIKQQQNLWEKVVAIEMIVTANWPAKKDAPLKTRGEKAMEEAVHPPVDSNGHPKLANGMVAQWQEVPSMDQLLKAANAYIEKHGKKAFKALLEKYQASKLTEVSGDENQARFMADLQG